MNFDDHNGNQDASGMDAGADDLSRALGDGGEAEFVTDAEPPARQNSTFVLVGVVVAALGGGFLLYQRGGPGSAEAATAQDDQTSQVVSSFLGEGTRNVELMQQMLRDTEKVVSQFLTYPSVKQVPLGELQTNPFRSQSPATGADAGAAEAAAKKQREQQRQAVLKAVGNLNLQSVIHGGAPDDKSSGARTRKACMINNALYSEGQQVDIFMIEKINPGSVVVRSDVFRFELKMQGSRQ